MRKFLKQFAKNPRGIGSVIPSSSRLINSMLKHIDFSNDLLIIEYGAGIGNFTRQILKKASPDSRLLVFEIENTFVEELKKINDPRIRIIHDGAQNLSKYIEGRSADVIVSGLPFGSLPKELTEEILTVGHKHLKMNGLYLQFQYFLQNKKDIYNTFKNHSISWEPINFPPAFVYKCHKIHN